MAIKSQSARDLSHTHTLTRTGLSRKSQAAPNDASKKHARQGCNMKAPIYLFGITAQAAEA
eukprot:6466483-Amphidinium_carterae.2